MQGGRDAENEEIKHALFQIIALIQIIDFEFQDKVWTLHPKP